MQKTAFDIRAVRFKKQRYPFEYEVPSVEEFKQRIESISEKYPYLVAENNGEIVGYAYAGVFKDRAAYSHCVENDGVCKTKCQKVRHRQKALRTS